MPIGAKPIGAATADVVNGLLGRGVRFEYLCDRISHARSLGDWYQRVDEGLCGDERRLRLRSMSIWRIQHMMGQCFTVCKMGVRLASIGRGIVPIAGIISLEH